MDPKRVNYILIKSKKYFKNFFKLLKKINLPYPFSLSDINIKAEPGDFEIERLTVDTNNGDITIIGNRSLSDIINQEGLSILHEMVHLSVRDRINSTLYSNSFLFHHKKAIDLLGFIVDKSLYESYETFICDEFFTELLTQTINNKLNKTRLEQQYNSFNRYLYINDKRPVIIVSAYMIASHAFNYLTINHNDSSNLLINNLTNPEKWYNNILGNDFYDYLKINLKPYES